MADEGLLWEGNIIRLDVKSSGAAKTYGEMGDLRVFGDRLMWRKRKSALTNPPWKHSLPFSSITRVSATRKDLLSGRLWISHTQGELCFHIPGGNDRAREIADFIASTQVATGVIMRPPEVVEQQPSRPAEALRPPSAPTQHDNPARWLPDPFQRHELRYWDGTEWTQHISDNGAAGVDRT